MSSSPHRSSSFRPGSPAVDFASDSALKLLLTELTGAGFDPSERCCVVAEGLLPFLSQVRVHIWG